MFKDIYCLYNWNDDFTVNTLLESTFSFLEEFKALFHCFLILIVTVQKSEAYFVPGKLDT